VPKNNFLDSIMNSSQVMSEEDSNNYFKEGDGRWAETLRGGDSPTGNPMIFINHRKYKKETGKTLSKNAIRKTQLSESLHNLKDVDPERYNKLLGSAIQNEGYVRWAKESYKYSQDSGEKRSFSDWHTVSRFDQVIGGYLFAGDKDFPTMKNWSRDKLPYGKNFIKELELLRKDLELD